MKPSKLLVSLRRHSAARISFIVASCVAAGAVALAAPQTATSSLRHVGKQPNLASRPVVVTADSLSSKAEPVSVMIEMDAPAASELYAEALKVAQASQPTIQPAARVPMASAAKGVLPRVQIDSAATARVSNHVATLDSAQKALMPSIQNVGAKVLYRTQRAFNGIAVKVAPEKIADLAKLPGVKSVRPMIPKYPTAFSDVDFLGARTFWNKQYGDGNVGIHGEGVKIAVIDTGLDYTHTNFGGPGTPNYAGITDKSPVPNAYFPTAKVPFGYDFAGNNYNADCPGGTCTAGQSDTPDPDPNPLDSAGHGTACASLIAGFGVNPGGSTYMGNYDDSTPIETMKISPGMAPRAQLIPLRIFGSAGSTNLTTEAIEYAMDPNGDGDLSDHVDIISMSLGSNWGTADDDSAIASSNAVAAGILVAAASGNAGDTYYITSSPASGSGVMSVAASYNDQAGYIYNLIIHVNQPNALNGTEYKAIYGAESPKTKNGTTRNVVQAHSGDASPTQGCSAFTNQAQISGNVALIDRGTCSFSIKIQNAEAAGAVGVIVVNNAAGDPITMSVPGTHIVSAMISQADGNQFKTAAAFDPTTGVPTNGANVTAYNRQGAVQRAGVAADTMPTYSSRGPLLSSTALKPDITAPAEVVGVAQTGTGNGVENFNGTSSATPHVAGGLALMRQLHPDWSVEEIMALAMNTSTHDLFKESGTAGSSAPTATLRGVSRVGAGRMDLTKASQSNVVIFNADDNNRVSMSYGVVEVPADGTSLISKSLTIRNKGTEDVVYNLNYDEVNKVGDATFSTPQSQYTIPAGQQITVPVAFTATGSTLRHTRDASVTSTQSGLGRQWLSEEAGYGVFSAPTPDPSATPVASPTPTPVTIRVPLYSAPKPVGAMRTVQDAITPQSNTQRFNLRLTGAPVFNVQNTSTDIIGLVEPFECQFVSPHAGQANFSSDPNVLKHVGVTSDYGMYAPDSKASTTLTFAMEGFGDASVPSYISSDKEVYIDVDFDGQDDFVLYADQVAGTNVYLSHLADAKTGAGISLQYFTNGIPGNSLDTNAYNNSLLLLSVDASALGYQGGGATSFQYHVATFDRSGQIVDLTPYMHFDVAKPGVNANIDNGSTPSGGFEPANYYADLPNGFSEEEIPVDFNGPNYQANNSKGILMAHMHNGRGRRGELVELRTPKITNFAPKQGPVGTTVTITGQNFANGIKVKFSPGVPADQVNVLSDNSISCKVPAGAVTGPIKVGNPAGSDVSNANFKVLPNPSPSPSPSPSPTVSPTGR